MKHIFPLLFLLLPTLFASCQSSNDDYIEPKGGKNQQQHLVNISDDYQYELPVIFHVLYKDQNDTNQYVSVARIKEILANVNDYWKGGKYDTQTPSQNMNVTFVLATTDEKGRTLTTPGIEYVRYTGTYPIDPYEFMSNRDNTRFMWDPNQYINIMLYNFANDNDELTTLGISHMPYAIESDSALAGLSTVKAKYVPLRKSDLSYCHCSSINTLYVSRSFDTPRYDYYKNTPKYQTEYSSRDISVTLAHELGHYLGLHHVFTESMNKSSIATVDSCGDTDYCTDTPSYNMVEYKAYIKDFTARKVLAGESYYMKDVVWRSSCKDGSRYDANNFMDYAFCYSNVFSKEQRDRVRWVLYYSPIVPGPKKNKANITRASTHERPINLHTRMVE